MVCTVDKPRFFEPIAFEKKREVPEGQLQCPRCRLTMEVFIVRGVPVDVCPDCRGLWLDSPRAAQNSSRLRLFLCAP